MSIPMGFGGIDEAQAARAGNKVTIENGDKVLRDGKTGEVIARVPQDDLSRHGDVTTMGATYGECGMAYVYITDSMVPKEYMFLTGFMSSKGPAFDFLWGVDVYGSWNTGTYHYEWSDYGPLFPPTSEWNSGVQVDDTTAPPWVWHSIEVTSGSVLLINGGICFPYKPSDGAWVF